MPRLNSFIKHKLVYDIIKFYIFIILVARRYYITGNGFFLSTNHRKSQKNLYSF